MVEVMEKVIEALKAAKEVADVAAEMTSCRSDDDFVWAAQAKIDAALEAALASPAEPSAYQWRMKHPAMADWSEWREGRANFSEDCGFLFEERSLYAHPPQQEPARLREALERIAHDKLTDETWPEQYWRVVGIAQDAIRAALAEDGL